MKRDRQDFIGELAAEVENNPVAPVQAPRVGLAWLLGAAVLVGAVMWVRAPFRAGALDQLLAQPQFLLESMLGVAALVTLTFAGFRAAIPGSYAPRAVLLPGLGLLLVWLGVYLAGFWWPAGEASMSGKRHECYYEVLSYGLPMLGIGLFVARRWWPLRPGTTGLLLGLAAGLTPALLMQFACMYEPFHALTHHFLPALLIGGLGWGLGYLVLRTASERSSATKVH